MTLLSMLSLTLKSILAPPTFLFILPVTFPTIVLSSEQLEGGLSVPDSCEEEDEEKTDPVFWGKVFPSPGSTVFAGVKEFRAFPLDSAIPSEEIAVPLILVVPFMML